MMWRWLFIFQAWTKDSSARIGIVTSSAVIRDWPCVQQKSPAARNQTIGQQKSVKRRLHSWFNWRWRFFHPIPKNLQHCRKPFSYWWSGCGGRCKAGGVICHGIRPRRDHHAVWLNLHLAERCAPSSRTLALCFRLRDLADVRSFLYWVSCFWTDIPVMWTTWGSSAWSWTLTRPAGKNCGFCVSRVTKFPDFSPSTYQSLAGWRKTGMFICPTCTLMQRRVWVYTLVVDWFLDWLLNSYPSCLCMD